ncbi:hypothetical protein D3C85_1018110 [compost metagenome]
MIEPLLFSGYRIDLAQNRSLLLWGFLLLLRLFSIVQSGSQLSNLRNLLWRCVLVQRQLCLAHGQFTGRQAGGIQALLQLAD